MTVYLKRVKSEGDCHTINTKKPCHFLNSNYRCKQGLQIKYPCHDLKRGYFVYIECETK